VLCLVELSGATRVSHNIQRAVATSQLYSSDASVVVCDGPECVYSTSQHLHASRVLPIDTRVAMPNTSYQLLELIHPLSKVYRILNSQVHRSLVKG
jgi:hypothetical protein